MNTSGSWKMGLGAGAIAAGVAISGIALASSSESLCYRSSTATICVDWNGPFDNACRSIFAKANRWMPVFLGIETEAAIRERRFSVCAGHHRQEVSIDGQPVELPAGSSWPELADALAEAIGCDIAERDAVPAFSIQLELLPPNGDAAARIKHWKAEVWRSTAMEEDLGLLSHVGDCGATPIWRHTYPNGRTAVRYGVFPTFSAAWQGVAALGFQRVAPQIVRTTLRADSLDQYFVP